MRRMLVSRISRRVLAEHHIALSKDFKPDGTGNSTRPDHVGIISTALNVQESLERCTNYLLSRAYDIDKDMPPGSNVSAAWPDVIVDGHSDTKFAYIQEHLECASSIHVFGLLVDIWISHRYIFFELLKNVSLTVDIC